MTEPSTNPTDLLAVAGEGGVVWSVSPPGFHTNLVALAPERTIEVHRNDAVDVLVVVLAGSANVTVDDRPNEVAATSALLVPRGTTRGVAAGPDGVRYLTIHAERPPLGITTPTHRSTP